MKYPSNHICQTTNEHKLKGLVIEDCNFLFHLVGKNCYNIFRQRIFHVTGRILHMNEICIMNINNFLKRNNCEEEKCMFSKYCIFTLYISTLKNSAMNLNFLKVTTDI